MISVATKAYSLQYTRTSLEDGSTNKGYILLLSKNTLPHFIRGWNRQGKFTGYKYHLELSDERFNSDSKLQIIPNGSEYYDEFMTLRTASQSASASASASAA